MPLATRARKTFDEFAEFTAALVRQWLAWLGGGLVIVGLGIYERLIAPVSRTAYVSVILGGLLLATYQAWLEQYRKATRVEVNPRHHLKASIRVSVGLYSPRVVVGISTARLTFKVANIGALEAQHVELQELLFGSYPWSFSFKAIGNLPAGSEQWVESATILRSGMEPCEECRSKPRDLYQFIREGVVHVTRNGHSGERWEDHSLSWKAAVSRFEYLGELRVCYADEFGRRMVVSYDVMGTIAKNGDADVQCTFKSESGPLQDAA
jgi:hypothetical protein